jgi:hypothetical protein
MKVVTTKVKEVVIGKNESGDYEYRDTGRVVNTGDKAYMVKNEDPITEEITKVFFESKEAAEKFN